MSLKYLPALLLVLVAATACTVPIRAPRVGPDTVYRALNANVLDPGTVSTDAMLVLRRNDLEETWDDDPEAAIRALHAKALEGDPLRRLYALTELCFAHAVESGNRDHYLASAVYAHILMVRSHDPTAGYDPRFRVTCDLYNRGIAEAFLDTEGTWIFGSGKRTLPVGSIDVDADKLRLPALAHRYDHYLPASHFDVRGLRSRNRQGGLGAPLIGFDPDPIADDEFVGSNSRVPFTAILRVTGGLAELTAGGVSGSLSLHDPLADARVHFAGESVPLEADVTTPLALSLGSSKLWGFEIAGFLGGQTETKVGLGATRPYERGKIPVVFVHGTASSPARWAEMFNELISDEQLRERYQFWFFVYETGNPIIYSAALLRRAIKERVQLADPEGTDAALNKMIIVGHSQGGLLTRLQTVYSDNVIWEQVSDQPFEDADLPPEDKQKLGQVAFFEPLPYVKRVIYISTPHGGSYVAGNWLGKIGSSLVSLPKRLTGMAKTLTKFSGLSPRLKGRDEFPTAVDNMDPDSNFVETLPKLRPGDIRYHSIIPIDGDDVPPAGDDGVVEYKRAHLEGAESEIIIRWNHSVQGHPRAITEVRRILHEALIADRR